MKKNILYSEITTIFNSIFSGIKMSFIEMKTHKLRSFLSTLGVMLGVASLVAMLTMIGGIDKFLKEKMSKWAGSVWYWTKWDPSEEEKILWNRSPGLHLSDIDYLKKESDQIKDAFSKITRYGTVKFGKSSENIVLRGNDSSTLALEKEEIFIKYGHWFNKEDFNTGVRNCVVSWEIADAILKEYHLKKQCDIIGKTITYGNVQFNVTGIYHLINKENNYYELKRGVIIPIKTMEKFITGIDPDPGVIQIQLKDVNNLSEGAKSVAIRLTEKHRGIQDFEYQAAEWATKITQMLNNISIIMGIISILSLAVGGLSIMNVMLSSISERIKEIGTRKALGADNWQIFAQFIAETSTLCFFGGLIGSCLGCIPLFFKEAIKKSTEGAIEPTILPLHICYIFLIILGLGILFGLYPALKASRMNPVDSLRYE